MLPIPFEKYIPKFFRKDLKLKAFADKIDKIINDLKNDTLKLNDIIDPTKTPSSMLSELGYYLNAGLKPYDSENQKRIKIGNAIKSHKKRGSFKFDAKIKIDTIAGSDSNIINNNSGDDWILFGSGTELINNYWASIGCDGLDDLLGIGLIGSGYEIEVAGNIYIDVDNPSLTVDQIERIVIELQDDVVGSYLRAFIGYIDVFNNFIIYAIIG